MSFSTIMALSVILTGLIIGGLAIPLLLGKVPPNELYGIRTAKTMSSPAIWYAANAYGGKALLMAGIATAAIGVSMLLLQKSIRLSGEAMQMLGVVAELGPLIAGAGATLNRIRSL